MPFEWIRINRSKNQTISFNGYNSIRFILTALGFLLNGFQVTEEFYSIVIANEKDYVLSDFVGSITKLLSYVSVEFS